MLVTIIVNVKNKEIKKIVKLKKKNNCSQIVVRIILGLYCGFRVQRLRSFIVFSVVNPWSYSEIIGGKFSRHFAFESIYANVE